MPQTPSANWDWKLPSSKTPTYFYELKWPDCFCYWKLTFSLWVLSRWGHLEDRVCYPALTLVFHVTVVCLVNCVIPFWKLLLFQGRPHRPYNCCEGKENNSSVRDMILHGDTISVMGYWSIMCHQAMKSYYEFYDSRHTSTWQIRKWNAWHVQFTC